MGSIQVNHEGFGCRFGGRSLCAAGGLGPDLAGQWRATLKALLQTAERPIGIDTLNAATVEFVQEVEAACATSAHWPGTWTRSRCGGAGRRRAARGASAAPGGRRAGDVAVRAVGRASLSVLLDVLQRQIEQERRADVPVSHRLMTVSWVRPDDLVRPATQSLHQGQRVRRSRTVRAGMAGCTRTREPSRGPFSVGSTAGRHVP